MKNIYKEIYVLSRHINIDPYYIESLSPQERLLYMGLYEQESAAEGQKEEKPGMEYPKLGSPISG